MRGLYVGFCRPNMAGKSSYIKQVALITILSHIGVCVCVRGPLHAPSESTLDS
jgi:hypothetical protein